MGKKRQDTDVELIRALINHPGWDLLKEKTQIIKDNADTRLHNVTKEGFDEAKGFCKGVKVFHDLIVLNPVEIINTKGVVRLKRS